MSIVPYFYDITKPFRMAERDFFQTPLNLVPREFFNAQFSSPWESALREWENFMRPVEHLSQAMNRLALNEIGTKVSVDDEKFQVNVDVQHFAPNEISVKVVEGSVVIEGKHEEKRDEHGYVSRQFVRRYALPKGCLPDTVQSSLSSDGVLTITAPKVLPMPSIGERIVPITPTGPVKTQIGSPDVSPMIKDAMEQSN